MSEKPSVLLTIAVLGGTGKQGKGLVLRWAKSGYRVIVGSRSPEKARDTAEEIIASLDGKAGISGMNYQDAANQADVVVLSIPYSAQKEILQDIFPVVQGKLLVNVAVPLAPSKATRVTLPPAGSAAQEALKILGKGVQVCTAFQNISHENLHATEPSECDVLVTGTSREARLETVKLVEAAGFRGWDAGPIENSIVVEGLTSVLIYINQTYHSNHAGIKIVGI